MFTDDEETGIRAMYLDYQKTVAIKAIQDQARTDSQAITQQQITAQQTFVPQFQAIQDKMTADIASINGCATVTDLTTLKSSIAVKAKT